MQNEFLGVDCIFYTHQPGRRQALWELTPVTPTRTQPNAEGIIVEGNEVGGVYASIHPKAGKDRVTLKFRHPGTVQLWPKIRQLMHIYKYI